MKSGGKVKYKKIYSLPCLKILLIYYYIFLFTLLLIIISNPKELWFISIPFLIFFSLYIYVISTGNFTPLFLNEYEIVYRGNKLSWDNIKITAYQIPSRGSYPQYILFLSKDYLDLKEIKTNRGKVFNVFLRKKILLKILNYYKYKILVLDNHGNLSKINSSKELNQIVNDHNKKTKLYSK